MGVAFLPYRVPSRPFMRLADVSLQGCDWRESPDPAPATVAELGPDDHVVVGVSSKAILARLGGTRCRVSLWLREPPCVQGRFYSALPWIGRRWHRILTHQASLTARCSNTLLVPHGGTWIRHPVDAMAPRTARIAMIASSKASTEGHRLRHRMAAWARTAVPDMALLGRGYRAFDDKADGHLPFMYSVVIENGSYPGYFTEKLVDCLRCGSIPIYWGDPEVARNFDMDGIIACRNEDELRATIMGADAAGFESRRPARLANAAIAERFSDPSALAAAALRNG
jgi:hypothetical protein